MPVLTAIPRLGALGSRVPGPDVLSRGVLGLGILALGILALGTLALGAGLLLASAAAPAWAEDAPSSISAAKQRQEPALTIVDSGGTRRLTRSALLARPDLTDIRVEDDVSYHQARSYRAVPLAHLLSAVSLASPGALAAAASDGFATDIPLRLLRAPMGDRAPQAFLAVEDPAQPWPALPSGGTTAGAGPFYIIWSGADVRSVPRELWPYQVVRLEARRGTLEQWPGLAVAASLPAEAPARHGQDVFIGNCLPCHRLNGNGDSGTGPDLGRPMSPTAYFQRSALHRYIRDPATLRDWPGRQMQGFGPAYLSDDDIEALIDYLEHMAAKEAAGK